MKRSTIVLALVVLAGCGGGQASSDNSEKITSYSGSVDRSVFAAENLRIVSGTQAPIPLSGDSFTITGLSDAHQLVEITTADGTIMGVASSTPKGNIRFDAESTAAVLASLSPGIVTRDPALASARRVGLSACPSFPNLVAVLKGGLGSSSLDSLLDDPAVKASLEAVRQEYWSTVPSRSRAATVETPDFQGGFKVSASGGESATTISLQNYGWRYLTIWREREDASGVRKDLFKTPMDGPAYDYGTTALAFYNLIFNGNSEMSVDETDLMTMSGSAGIARTTYWVFGPGLATSSLDTSDSTLTIEERKKAERDALTRTVFEYAIRPLVSYISDGMGKDSDVIRITSELLSGFEMAQDIDDLQNALNRGDLPAASEKTATIAAKVFGYFDSAEFAGRLPFRLKVKYQILKAAKAFNVGQKIMDATNLSKCVAYWMTSPATSRFTVRGSGATNVVVK